MKPAAWRAAGRAVAVLALYAASALGAAGATASRIAIDPDVEARLLALDPERVSTEDVHEVLARSPAPHVIGLHGSVPIVDMSAFAEFLVAMGYPPARLRNPADGTFTYASFGTSQRLAGIVAWHYERDGVVPMLIGHSLGGMLVVRALLDLAGERGSEIPVWDPVRDTALPRTTIVDPLNGSARLVVGLRVPYAAVLATGSPMRTLLGRWGMLPPYRSVPDSVEEFTAFFVAWDPIAGTGSDPAAENPYRPTGSAQVRNVTLPADYGHIGLPLAGHLAANPATRAWIERYDPRTHPPLPPPIAGADVGNIVHAADIWYSIKKHWALAAQRLVRAKRSVEARP